MKNHSLLIAIAICLIITIAVLNGAEVYPNISSIDVTSTTTPIKSPQKNPCVIPTPTAKPNVNQSKRPEVGLDINQLAEVLKGWDRDCDGVSDYDDNCREEYNPKQTDRNRNGWGDACDEPKPRRKRTRNKQKQN